jgi:hypothetical protein
MSHFDKGPSFLIIGAMKCATSTLHAQLGAQPGIYTTDFKEPNFFGADETHDRGIEWYESLFAAAPPSSPRGESSTHYTKRDEFPHACERIHRYAPDLRLVYVMRHPMARLVSHYTSSDSGRTRSSRFSSNGSCAIPMSSCNALLDTSAALPRCSGKKSWAP